MQLRMTPATSRAAARPAQRQLLAASRVARKAQRAGLVIKAATALEAPPAKGDLKTADPKQAELSIK